MAAEAIIERWRGRLIDIGWFMRCLNEHIARRANLEDGCKGRFWEGRFQSQALLDDAGLLTAMAYVDLNPIRAGIAATPEESSFTSIYERIRDLKAVDASAQQDGARARVPLMGFASSPASTRKVISFGLREYLELVDWTGRRIVEGKVGAIEDSIPRILRRLNIDVTAWSERCSRAAMCLAAQWGTCRVCDRTRTDLGNGGYADLGGRGGCTGFDQTGHTA